MIIECIRDKSLLKIGTATKAFESFEIQISVLNSRSVASPHLAYCRLVSKAMEEAWAHGGRTHHFPQPEDLGPWVNRNYDLSRVDPLSIRVLFL
jgi:hypothetical protein